MNDYHVWKESESGKSDFIVSGNLEYCRSVVKLLLEGDTSVDFWIEDDIGRFVTIEE